MSRMINVLYSGKCDHIIEEYNGKRYSWRRGDIVEVPQEVFIHLQNPGHLRRLDFEPVVVNGQDKPTEIKQEQPPEQEQKIMKKKPGRPKFAPIKRKR